jgi:hypothetical protein
MSGGRRLNKRRRRNGRLQGRRIRKRGRMKGKGIMISYRQECIMIRERQ